MYGGNYYKQCHCIRLAVTKINIGMLFKVSSILVMIIDSNSEH